MAVSKRLRHEVMRRDSYTCRYCGATAPSVKLTIDHVTPKTLGGTDDPSNLVTACVDCNAGKSATPPDAPLVATVRENSDRWVDAVAEATVRRNDELQRQRVARRVCDAFELLWEHRCPQYELGPGWRQSVTQLYAKGLDEDFLSDAIQLAAAAEHVPAESRWRYFCGVGWRELDRRQEMATAVVARAAPAVVVASVATDDEFPIMEMFGTFLEDLMRTLRIDERIQKIVHRSFWDGIPHADRAWREAPPDVDPEEESPRYDLAREELTSWIARDMYQIQQILAEARDGT